MSLTSMHSNTPSFAKNGTARTTVNTTVTRAQDMALSGGKPRLTNFQKASHVAEMTQDGFTMVDRSKTYAQAVARKSTPPPELARSTARNPTAQSVTGETNDRVTDRLATVKGTLTTAINSQRVMSTNVSFLEEEKDKQKALIKALDKLELRKKLHKAFGIRKAFGVEETQEFTHHLLTMKEPTNDALNLRSITMQGNNHSYNPSVLSKIFFPKKPMIG